MKTKLILISILVCLLISAAPMWGVTTRDVPMYDLFTQEWITVPSGTAVISYESRQGGAQTWYLCNMSWDNWFYHGWIPGSAIQWNGR